MGAQYVPKLVLKEYPMVLLLILRNKEFLNINAAFWGLCDNQKDLLLDWRANLRYRGRFLK